MSSHCRHCSEDCRAGKIGWTHTRDHWSEGEEATWERHCCPACAEADRIAEWCDQQSAKWYGSEFDFDDGMCIAFEQARNFARGKS